MSTEKRPWPMSTRSRPETSRCLIQTRNQSVSNSDGFYPDAGEDAAADDAIRVPHLPRRAALHLVWRHHRTLHLFRGKTVIASIGLIYFPRSVGERFNVGVWFNVMHVCDGHCRCDSTATFVSYCVF